MLMSLNHPPHLLNRRESLKHLALGAGALAFPKILRANGTLESNGLTLAVQQYSFNRQLNDGSLDILDYPKTVVEGTGIKVLEYFNGHIRDKSGDTRFFRELKKRCNDLGATCTLMLCRSDVPLDSPNASTRYQAVEGYIPWMEAVRLLGGKAIRVDCRSNGDFEEQKKYAIDGLQQLCDVAAPFGMNILVENHGGFSSNGKWLADVMRKVGKRNCGTLPDFQNFKEYDPYLGVEEMMPFAKIVCAKSKEFDQNGNEVNVDYKRMMKIVLDSGYKGSIGIEFEGHGVDPVKGILATKRLIERVIGELA